MGDKYIGLGDRLAYLYLRKVKKQIPCPACKSGAMTINKKSTRWKCDDCGYGSTIDNLNLKGMCSVCGKTVPDSDAIICGDCRKVRREKVKKYVAITVGVAAAIAGTIYLVKKSTDDAQSEGEDFLPDTGDDFEDSDEVYGLGDGKFPYCYACGAEMTEFDGCAWYICPACGNKVRIIDGVTTWYNEIFKEYCLSILR